MYRVSGVLPADFELPALDVALLVPFAFSPEQKSDQERGREFSRMIARLRPGASIAGVEAEMSTIIQRNLERLPQRRAFVEQSGFRAYAVPIRDQLVGDVRTPLYLLQAGVFLVLLIACVNVANLMLMRASERQRELALRLALGAGRRDLVRQLLLEGMVISFAGALSGVLLALAVLPGLVTLVGDQLPTAIDAAPHLPMLLAAGGLAVIIGLFAGIVPALAILRGDLLGPLNEEGGRTAGSRRSARTHSALVIVETGLALTLLVGAGLLIKSVASLQGTHPGFSPARRDDGNAVPAPPRPTRSLRIGPASGTGCWRMRSAIPGVTAAGLTSKSRSAATSAPAPTASSATRRVPAKSRHMGARRSSAAITSRRCRYRCAPGAVFDERDGPDAPPVVIVDEFLVQRYFRRPARRSVGRSAGAVRTVPPSPSSESSARSTPSISRCPWTRSGSTIRSPSSHFATMAVVLKTAVEPSTVVAPLRQAVRRDRSRAANRHGANDGRVDVSFDGDAPRPHAVVRGVRRGGAAPGSDRHIRGAGVRRVATHA